MRRYPCFTCALFKEVFLWYLLVWFGVVKSSVQAPFILDTVSPWHWRTRGSHTIVLPPSFRITLFCGSSQEWSYIDLSIYQYINASKLITPFLDGGSRKPTVATNAINISQKKSQNPWINQYISMSICQHVSMSVCQCVNMSTCQYVNMSIYKFVYISIYQYVNMSICLYINMSIYKYVYT